MQPPPQWQTDSNTQQWPQSPQPPRHSNSKAWVVAGAIVTAALILGVAIVAVAWLYLDRRSEPIAQPTATPTTPAPIEVDGDLELMEEGRHPKFGRQCAAKSAGYDDITAGAQVTVTNEAGTVLAVGTLQNGTGTGTGCKFPFTVTVPPGHQFYGFEISHRGVIRYSEEQLRTTGAHLSLGDA